MLPENVLGVFRQVLANGSGKIIVCCVGHRGPLIGLSGEKSNYYVSDKIAEQLYKYRRAIAPGDFASGAF